MGDKMFIGEEMWFTADYLKNNRWDVIMATMDIFLNKNKDIMTNDMKVVIQLKQVNKK